MNMYLYKLPEKNQFLFVRDKSLFSLYKPKELGDLPLVPEKLYKKYEKHFGYIDTKGAWTLKPQFPDASDFKGGLARVMFPEGNWGYIDASGKKIWESPIESRL